MSMSNDLCEELVVEIFLRLPPKSLLRFRTVSKSLCDRIDSPGFIRLHTLYSPKKFTVIHRVPDKGIRDKIMYTMHSEDQLSSYAGLTSVQFPFWSDITVVGSCNGIVCYEYYNDIIHLWNPSIRRKLTMHDLPSPSHTGFCEFTHGFGFDPIIEDYKILRISKARTFVYTMKMNTWREVASPGPPFDYMYSTYQCHFNGALYWVAVKDSNHYDDDNDYHYILRFDLSSEVFSMIELPKECSKCSEVTIVKGCLGVICNHAGGSSRIWVRNNDDAVWSFVDIEVHEHESIDSAHGDILFSHYSEGIMVYNLDTEARSRLETLGDPDSSSIIDMITCTKSLALLDMGTSCDVIKRIKLSKRVKLFDVIKGSKSFKRVKYFDLIRRIKSSKRVKFSDLIKGIKSSKRRKFS